MKRKLKNISGIDYEWNEDEGTALRRRMGPGVTDFRQTLLTASYDDTIDTAKKVLEIGCGAGRNAQYFGEHTDAFYYGFDASPLSVEYFKNGNMYWQPPPEDRYYVSNDIDETILGQEYDLIFSMFTLNHIGFYHEDDVHDSISISKELWPTLKSGGIWMSYELGQGQNSWSPDRWLEESFDRNSYSLKTKKMVTLMDVDGKPLNDEHVLIVLQKK